MFTQIPFKQTSGPSSSHSSMSSHMWLPVLNRVPLGQIHCSNIVLKCLRLVRASYSDESLHRESFFTYLKATRNVATLTTAAQRILQFALVYVGANFSCRVHFVTAVADATIGPHKIFAAAVYTDIRILRALVDVCTNGSITVELLLLCGFCVF